MADDHTSTTKTEDRRPATGGRRPEAEVRHEDVNHEQPLVIRMLFTDEVSDIVRGHVPMALNKTDDKELARGAIAVKLVEDGPKDVERRPGQGLWTKIEYKD